ncbi:DUF6171 family protein [Schlesneria sp. DSM 10557]|uniref:DUF6171 family protein n=1 Tax=Schlesneria sp. DSM 10557 TaxID=3044399 RepID=UPI0035A0FC27
MEISEETRQLAKKTIVQQEGETFDSYYSRYTAFVISQMFPNSETSSTGATIPADQRDLDAAMSKAPSLLIKGVNFGRAWAWNAFHGFARSSEALIKKRLAVCQACPSFEDSHCKLCGCRCELKNHLMNKLAMKTAECPLKKW